MKEQNLKPRAKGDPPLPGAGRPKGSLNVKTVLAKFLKVKTEGPDPFNPNKKVKLTQLDIIVLKQVEKAQKGDTAAFNAVMDRWEGKAEQKITNAFEEGTEINLTVGKPIRPGQKEPEQPIEPETPDA